MSEINFKTNRTKVTESLIYPNNTRIDQLRLSQTKRTTVARTQAIFLIGTLIIMTLIVTGVGVFSIQTFQSDVDVNMTDFYKMMLGLFLLMFATSAISFYFSSVFNLSKNSLLFGGGLPIAFFLLHLMSSFSTDLEKLKYFSLNTLFDTSAIVKGDSIVINFVVLIFYGTLYLRLCKSQHPTTRINSTT